MAARDGDLQRVPAKQSPSLSSSASAFARRHRIRFRFHDGEGHVRAQLGQAFKDRNGKARGPDPLGSQSLRICLSPEERVDELPEKTRAHRGAVQAVALRPTIFGKVAGPEQAVDPRKVDREITIDSFRLGRVMPMMIARRDQVVLQPNGAWTKVRVRPGGVEGDKQYVAD